MELESGQNLNLLLVKVINVNFVHNIFVVYIKSVFEIIDRV